MTDRHEHRMYLNDVMARAEERLARKLAAPETTTGQPARGTCPVCSRGYRLKADGTLRSHWKRDGMGKGLPFSAPCPGAGTLPKEAAR